MSSTARSVLGVDELRGFRSDELLQDFRTACLSRAIDDRAITLHKQGKAYFQISGAGHEALLCALAQSLRPGYDWFFPYYRDLALVLALGVSPTTVLLQAVGSADDPASGGRQMPSHWGDPTRNIVTQSSPTGSQCLPAVGCAEAGRYIVRRQLPGCRAYGDEVVYVSLGDGATSEGEFWESLNTACKLHLPVLYVVADNGYAISVRSSDQTPATISELTVGFRGLAVYRVNGCDYFESRRVGSEAIARVRAGEGPALVHATVTRPYSHSSADMQQRYRSSDELAAEASHDPVLAFGKELERAGVIGPGDIQRIRSETHQLALEAAEAALAATRPDPATVTHHIWSLPDTAGAGGAGATGRGAAGAGEQAGAQDVGVEPEEGKVLLGEAIHRVLFELMEGDERIRVFGEDVADAEESLLLAVEGQGGVFGVTKGLQRRFGIARCYNTPLAEANIVGRAVGQAVRGLHPCAEVQFFDYIWPAMQQIRSEAATIRWRSNGAFSCPMVVRVAIGGYIPGGAIWHSQSGESIFTHIPGLVVVFPSRAADAARLLRTAFACGDPVLFLEHKHLLRQRYAADPFPARSELLPLGTGTIARPGEHVTIATWGATVQKSIVAAEQVKEASGIEAEVIDLRCLQPWDQELVAASVERTSRLLVVHEDTITCGFGAEVAAWVGEHCFSSMDAPVSRVGALDTLVAYAPELERATLPQVDTIARALEALARY